MSDSSAFQRQNQSFTISSAVLCQKVSITYAQKSSVQKSCGVGGKHRGRYTVGQVLISGQSQYSRDATSETQIELLELLITESRVFHSQITSLITRCPKNTLDLRQKLHSILMSI